MVGFATGAGYPASRHGKAGRGWAWRGMARLGRAGRVKERWIMSNHALNWVTAVSVAFLAIVEFIRLIVKRT